MKRLNRATGFTIVELLIVVVVIAILAAIVIVTYQGIVNQANGSSLKADLRNTAMKLANYKATQGAYPGSLTSDLSVTSTDTTLNYVWKSDTAFCMSAASSKTTQTFYITEAGTLTAGECPPVYIQTITTAACSTDRTLVADARDNRSYWIKKHPDGKCWMLTNLAYAGGGTNTYSDVKTLQNGTGDTSNTYTAPKYYVHSSANPTTSPASPSLSTDGGATSPQYGYHYNWCAASGAQLSTSACMNATTPLPNTTTSVCPANWRLPTTTEFQALITTVNNGSTSNDTGLRDAYAQRGGIWNTAFANQSIAGYQWSSGQASASNAYMLSHNFSFASGSASTNKERAISVRCVAS